MTPVTGPDWGAIRRAYDGGRGGTIEALAERFGVSYHVLARRSQRERWRRRSDTAEAIRRRIVQIADSEPETTAREIHRRLVAEFGEGNGEIPAVRTITEIRAKPKKPWPKLLPPPRKTLDGLTRLCYACGQVTTADPCAWCATDSHEVAA